MPPRRVPFDHILSFFSDIASGLQHLHSNGFIHRDLKPSNCLLTQPHVPGQPPKVLVSDFGEVQMENTMRSSTGATGTISYCAPEVLKRGKCLPTRHCVILHTYLSNLKCLLGVRSAILQQSLTFFPLA